ARSRLDIMQAELFLRLVEDLAADVLDRKLGKLVRLDPGGFRHGALRLRQRYMPDLGHGRGEPVAGFADELPPGTARKGQHPEILVTRNGKSGASAPGKKHQPANTYRGRPAGKE